MINRSQASQSELSAVYFIRAFREHLPKMSTLGSKPCIASIRFGALLVGVCAPAAIGESFIELGTLLEAVHATLKAR